MKKNKEKEEKIDPKKKRNDKLIALLIIAGLVVGIVYLGYRMESSTSTSASAVIDGIECNTQEMAVQHIHTHLDIFVNDHSITIPEFIGIVDNTCLYWLHTHKTNGVIHIESPLLQQYTLGQFFDIWRSTGKMDLPTNSPIIFVNGLKVDTSLNNLKLNAHDEIVLVYGTMPSSIPAFYQFDPGE